MRNIILQWHQTGWDQFMRRVREGRLPHALLLMGEKGIGKSHFANIMATSLLCASFHQTGECCHQCQSCHLSNAENHPDLLKIESEPGHAIKVDQIRDITTFVNQTPLLGGYRVIIINPASSMNINAANALLKTLEEPTQNVLLILISDSKLNLPATILSRCQKMILRPPKKEQGLNWLRENINESEIDLSFLLSLCQNAPLAALDYFKQGIYQLRQEFYQSLSKLLDKKADPVELSQQWQEKNIQVMLQLLLSWINDLMRMKVTAIDEAIVNQDYRVSLVTISQKKSLDFLLRYRAFVQQIYKHICAGHNLNQRLLIENMLIKLI